MNEWFEKVPLQELVAEVRWHPPGVALAQGGMSLSFDGSSDEFFLRFAGALSGNQFTQAERLVPSGFPYMHQNIVYRFRRPNDASSLIQVGPGVFTANALPPYKRWRDFRPTVVTGIEALLATRPPAEGGAQFAGHSLRYIDAFSGELLGGGSEAEFIEKILSFKVAMPETVRKLVGDGLGLSTSINLLFPIVGGAKTVRLNIGDGTSNGAKAVILDMTVSENNPIDASLGAIMNSFDSSRAIIHDTFLELTKPLHSVMKLQKDNINAA